MVRESSFVAAALALVIAACPPTRYAYAPVTTTSAELVGHPAADHPFPPESPHGRVQVATFGIVQLAPDAPRFFHVRMSAQNEGSAPWVVDKKDQLLDIGVGDTGARKERVRAATDADRSPAQTTIAPGKTAAVDLFFPLPANASSATEIPALELVWTVREGTRPIVMATPFERFLASGPALAVPRPEPTYQYGAGPPRRLPGTPTTRWPQPEPRPDPELTPQPPIP
jgi:hypothetical protein